MKAFYEEFNGKKWTKFNSEKVFNAYFNYLKNIIQDLHYQIC